MPPLIPHINLSAWIVFNSKTSDDNDEQRSLPRSFTISIDSKFQLLVNTTGGDSYRSQTRLLNTRSSDDTLLTLSDGILTNSDRWVATWPYPMDPSLGPKRLVFPDLSIGPFHGAVEFRAQNTTEGYSIAIVGPYPVTALPGAKPGAELMISVLDSFPAGGLKVIDA
ncbi:hypothetical protein N7G274_001145 [Stereocaulon virgatum]|uniref:Uncharacterized protein n=1 Tax=Stereocaulon virgatum TaxID=373712 RepID=A0ABR4ANM5_9LECA